MVSPNPKVRVMKPFGEMALVEDNAGQKIWAKLENHGHACCFWVMPQIKQDDTYHFLNLTTKKVIVSQDVVWLGKCYGDWRGITGNVINAVPTDNDDPYYTDNLIDDQEYPSNNQGRVMEPDGGMMKMIILLLSRLMKRIMRIWHRRRIPVEKKMWKIITIILPIQTLSL
jgi:hypothetical protein